MERFADKVVLITGAASGIGRATAERLATEGAALALSDVNAEGLEATAETCRAAGARVFCQVSNVADEAQVADLVAAAVSEHGRLDVAVNVAGILHFEDLRRTELADWDRIIAVNLTGTFLVCRAVMDHLLATGGNKTRKLEFLVADALAQGADTLITCGAPQSNHCRITLSAAIKEGLKCRFVIEERVPGSYRKEAGGNNFMFELMGVEAITVVPGGSDMGAAMSKVAQEVAALGRKGYVIPGGGSNATGRRSSRPTAASKS